MKEISKILDKNEKVFWEGTPQLWPFVANSLPVSFFGLFFLGFSIFWVIGASKAGGFFALFGIPFVGIGLSIVGTPIYKLLVKKHTHYAISNKRVLIQTGIIGRDFLIVDFDKIQNATAEVNVFDKVFGQNSGSISIFTAGTDSQKSNNTRYKLCNVTNPYKVFKFLKITSHDIKTDIEYPNKLRPKQNPGYKTEYTQ